MISQKLADKIAALAEEAKQSNDAETIALASILYTIKGSIAVGQVKELRTVTAQFTVALKAFLEVGMK